MTEANISLPVVAVILACVEIEMTHRKIITNNVYPPIPVRCFDWCAYFEGEEESGNYGWGETAEAAIKDLKQRYEDEQ